MDEIHMIKILNIFKRNKNNQNYHEEHLEPLDVPVYTQRNKGGRPRVLNDITVIQIMQWKSENMSNCAIARRLNVSEATVRNYLKNLSTHSRKN